MASSCASAGAVPAPLRPSTRMPSARRALANCAAACGGGPTVLREAAVEGQRAQDPADVAVVGAAGVEGAAQEVEARLVAEDRPVDAQDPGGADRAREALQVVAAERRVAAAAQVEVAAPDPVGVEEAAPGERSWPAWRRARSASGRRRSCRASRPRRARAGASALAANSVRWLSRSRTKAPEKPPAWRISRVSLACSVGVEIAEAAPAGRTASAATSETTRARTR